MGSRRAFPVAILLVAVAVGCAAEGWQEPWPGRLWVRGSGRVVSEIREVHDVTGIELKGIGEVAIFRGRSEKLEIEAEDNILDLITTDVERGVLVIDYSRGGRAVFVRPTRPVRIRLTMRDLGRISTFGSGTVQASGLSGDLEVSTFGSGGVRLSAAWLDSLRVSIAGSGDIEAEGSSTEQRVTVAGSGSYRAAGMSGTKVTIRIQGSGSAVVGPADSLDVTILGSGSVGYYGRPRVNQTVMGSGSIRNLGERP